MVSSALRDVRRSRDTAPDTTTSGTSDTGFDSDSDDDANATLPESMGVYHDQLRWMLKTERRCWQKDALLDEASVASSSLPDAPAADENKTSELTVEAAARLRELKLLLNGPDGKGLAVHKRRQRANCGGSEWQPRRVFIDEGMRALLYCKEPVIKRRGSRGTGAAGSHSSPRAENGPYPSNTKAILLDDIVTTRVVGELDVEIYCVQRLYVLRFKRTGKGGLGYRPSQRRLPQRAASLLKPPSRREAQLVHLLDFDAEESPDPAAVPPPLLPASMKHPTTPRALPPAPPLVTSASPPAPPAREARLSSHDFSSVVGTSLEEEVAYYTTALAGVPDVSEGAIALFFEVVYAAEAPSLTSEDMADMSRVDAAINAHKILLAGLLSSSYSAGGV